MNDDEKINQLDNLIPKWFAIYTQPKMEKTVFQQLVNTLNPQVPADFQRNIRKNRNL